MRYQITAALIFAAGSLSSTALAQAFPSQPLEFVAHTSAGGGTDQFARLMAEIFTREKLVSQAPVVSNRVGGGGAIAYNYVKGKRGDPHVILAVATGTFMSALTRPDLGFTIEDFTPLAFFAMDPQVVAVTADTKFTNVKDLIEAAKREPNTIVSAIASATGSGRLFQYVLEKETGAKFKYVSFKSGAEAGTAVAGGHIQLTTENLSEVAPHLESKRVRVLAVTGERRMVALPDVPTMKEAGYPIVVGTGRAFAMPPGVPKEAAAAAEGMLKRAFASKIWKDYSATNNFEDSYLDGAQFRKYIESRREEFRGFLLHVGLLKK
ncbi:MAG: tripartite tricarboxylate transporter substrate binding protein [Burkholderiales bacterium]